MTGETTWELLHRCDRIEINFYLEKRASQGFNVIQSVVLAEIDRLNTPNPYGNTPLDDIDPQYPNDEYFQLVDYAIKDPNIISKKELRNKIIGLYGENFGNNSYKEYREFMKFTAVNILITRFESFWDNNYEKWITENNLYTGYELSTMHSNSKMN